MLSDICSYNLGVVALEILHIFTMVFSGVAGLCPGGSIFIDELL